MKDKAKQQNIEKLAVDVVSVHSILAPSIVKYKADFEAKEGDNPSIVADKWQQWKNIIQHATENSKRFTMEHLTPDAIRANKTTMENIKAEVAKEMSDNNQVMQEAMAKEIQELKAQLAAKQTPVEKILSEEVDVEDIFGETPSGLPVDAKKKKEKK